MNITTSFDSFIALTLDYGLLECRPLPDYETGLIIQTLIKDSTLFKVQFEEFDGTPLTYPKLWRYDAWYNSSTKWKRDKDISDRNRVLRWIEEANIKIVGKCLMSNWEYGCDDARAKATQLVVQKKWGTIRALGVKKIITKEEELN